MVILKGLITEKIVREINKTINLIMTLEHIKFASETVMLDFVERIKNWSIDGLIMYGCISHPEFYRRLTNIKYLHVSRFDFEQDTVANLRHLMPSLYEITLRPNYVDTVDVGSLFKLGTKLRKIALNNIIVVSAEFMTVMTQCKDLDSLDISSVTCEAANILGEWLPNSNLTRLHLFTYYLEFGNMIIDALPSSKIENFRISGQFDTDYLIQTIPRTRIVGADIFCNSPPEYTSKQLHEIIIQKRNCRHAVNQNKIKVPIRRNLNALMVSNTVSPDLASLLPNYLINQ